MRRIPRATLGRHRGDGSGEEATEVEMLAQTQQLYITGTRVVSSSSACVQCGSSGNYARAPQRK